MEKFRQRPFYLGDARIGALEVKGGVRKGKGTELIRIEKEQKRI